MPMATRRLNASVLAVVLTALACAPHSRGGAPPAGGVADRGGSPTIPVRELPVFPATWRFRAGREAAFGTHGMVVSNNDLASQAGVEILQRGGNAVDAAVATGFALAVTYPAAGNLGGGGFMVLRMADGRTAALDYREVAPLAATRDMYVGPGGTRTDWSLVGHLASGVPGAVAGMAAALARYGTMPLREVIQPAIRLAEEGFVVDSAMARSLRADSGSISRFAGAELFLPGGHPLAPGMRLVQPDLARTLRRIAEGGAREFYTGETARLLVAEMKRGGGIIAPEDLERYRPVWRTPLQGTYGGYTLIGMPPSSSGGTTMIEAMNILESFGALPPFSSTAYKHLLAEALRRAFIDRNTKLCDPAFCAVPVEQLTSKRYARDLARGIDRSHASSTPHLAAAPTGTHTTHYSVVDAAGNAVATTTTLNGGYGSGVWVPGAGFFLNNEMDDLATIPGKPNMFGLIEGEQNAVQPGKRPLSSMTPTIVLDPHARVLLVIGAAGGPTIISGTMQVVLNVLVHRMTLADAMAAPRMHHQAWPDSIRYEEGGFTPAVADSLRAMGHGLSGVRALTNVNAIMRVRGGWEGVSEPRAVGKALGY